MTSEYSKGNFEFVRSMYEDVAKELQTAEKNSRLDLSKAGGALRKSLEGICNHLLRENNLWNDYKEKNLNEKIEGLNGRLYDHFTCNNYEGIDGNTYPNASYKRSTGHDGIPWYTFVRQLGNTCSHHDLDKGYYPAANYDNVKTALKNMFDVLSKIYKRKGLPQNNIQPKKFNEDYMPIGNLFVVTNHRNGFANNYIPMDKKVSYCTKEYLMCSLDEYNNIHHYEIVRLYDKKNIDNDNNIDRQLYVLRDNDAFSQAMKAAGFTFDGSGGMEIISPLSKEESDFYIIGYIFYSKPEHLSDELLKTLSTAEKKEICIGIARILACFHNLSTPIYHRNLSYDSIYICKNENGVHVPCIIKLDFAKILAPFYDDKTVYSNVQANQKLMKEEQTRFRTIEKYRDPQMEDDLENNRPSDWEKGDIYSLGVLFGDILYGSVKTTEEVSGYQLTSIDDNLSDFAAVIDKMTDPDPVNRPDAREVVRMLTEGK